MLSRRLAKRSIIGTKVSAPGSDDYYHTGTIVKVDKAENADGGSREVFTVLFEPGFLSSKDCTKDFTKDEILGPGFMPLNKIQLKLNQKVFTTHMGREVPAYVDVQKQDRQPGEIFVRLGEDSASVPRKIDELWLIESRKSPRGHHDTDYLKLANTKHSDSHRNHQLGNVASEEEPSMDEEPSMNEVMAAMVLTSLSSSPSVNKDHLGEKFAANSFCSEPLSPGSFCESPLSLSFNSSDYFSWESRSLPTNIHYSSHTKFDSLENSNLCDSPQSDEGIDLNDGGSYPLFDDISNRKRKHSQCVKKLYRCTWPGCGKVLSSCSGIEKHVRNIHLGKNTGGDHEEEFYYSEVETDVDKISETFANMHASSPPTLSHMDMARPPHEDPSLFIKSPSLSSPHSPRAVKIPQQHKGLTSQIDNIPSTVNMTQIHNQRIGSQHKFFSSSPKSFPLTQPCPKKIKSDGRKCRKVYGMENRDLWCTQCRWKKACVRFSD